MYSLQKCINVINDMIYVNFGLDRKDLITQQA